MWNSYFFQIQKKYNMKLSTTKPLIIRFDGKDITKDKNINLLFNNEGSFSYCLEETCKYFSKKYNCYSIFGSDEINFIFTNPMEVIADLDADKCNHSNEVIAMFSQYFFNYFNTCYKSNKVFWHGKCFSIPNEKLNSYIKYRSGVIKNVMSTYFLKRKGVKTKNVNSKDRANKCELYNDYESCQKNEEGILYFSGEKIDLSEFFNLNIIKVHGIKNTEKNSINVATEIEFFDF